MGTESHERLEHGPRLAKQLAIVALLGAAAGGATGLLGRLAMRVLAVTSPQIAQRRLTDDLARVGDVTLHGTAFVVLLCAVLGAAVAVMYLMIRLTLPTATAPRIVGFALLTGVVGGSIIVHDEPSFDYTVLQPTWLAVNLFVLVPAAYGAMAAGLIERFAPRGGLLGSGRRLERPVLFLGYAAYAVLVLRGAYGLSTDIISLAMDKPSNAPLTL